MILPSSPAGWDNDKKIGILHENFQTLKAEDSFEDTIRKPPVRKVKWEVLKMEYILLVLLAAYLPVSFQSFASKNTINLFLLILSFHFVLSVFLVFCIALLQLTQYVQNFLVYFLSHTI